ncbi:hypothetical protein AJ80_03307 [Polytolypa hystricis UAMH7299]|uniref:Uncharacterized protein n=1 Tax=Polytolypa hystricis (strain UAMH7299) TaxID=1447883 RepID=A0A2B7YJN7_POLH7|nr:hypothetical protein AJ80_03307 [Polytolypa hystricis UAMH7299]
MAFHLSSTKVSLPSHAGQLRTNLTTLPNELLLLISKQTRRQRDLNSFARSNKRLYALLNPQLYQQDVKYGGCRALWLATLQANIGMAQHSLNAGADVNIVHWGTHRRTPLLTAVRECCDNWGKKMSSIHRGVDLDKVDVKTWLEKQSNYIRFLVSRGADIHYKEPGRKDFAFRYAGLRAQIEVMRILLDAGADPNVSMDAAEGVRNMGETLAHSLIYRLVYPISSRYKPDYLKALQVLLEYGADLNARDKRGATPLNWAVDVRDDAEAGISVEERIKLLIEHGADVNAKDNQGRTPLSIALSRKPPHELLVKVLLENGADISLRSDEVSGNHG